MNVRNIEDIKSKYQKITQILSILPNIDDISKRSLLDRIFDIIDLLLIRDNDFFMNTIKSIIQAKQISVNNINESILSICKSNNWTEFEFFNLQILFLYIINYIYIASNKHIQFKNYYDKIIGRLNNYRNLANEIIIDYTFHKMIQDNTFYEMLEDDKLSEISEDSIFNDFLDDDYLLSEQDRIKTFDELFTN